MSDLLLSADAMTVPCSQPQPLVLDMRKIHKAESRLHELATLTKPKAGELEYTFLDAYGAARDYWAILTGEFGRVKQKLRTAQGIAILDKAADVLKEKGIIGARSNSGSEDQRKAVTDTDVTYLQWADILSQVEVAMNRMEAKVDKLKMAYFSAGVLTRQPDAKRDVSGGVGDDMPGAMTQTEKVQQFVRDVSTPSPRGFGKAKL